MSHRTLPWFWPVVALEAPQSSLCPEFGRNQHRAPTDSQIGRWVLLGLPSIKTPWAAPTKYGSWERRGTTEEKAFQVPPGRKALSRREGGHLSNLTISSKALCTGKAPLPRFPCLNNRDHKYLCQWVFMRIKAHMILTT